MYMCIHIHTLHRDLPGVPGCDTPFAAPRYFPILQVPVFDEPPGYSLTVRLHVYKYCILWGLKYMNVAYLELLEPQFSVSHA